MTGPQEVIASPHSEGALPSPVEEMFHQTPWITVVAQSDAGTIAVLPSDRMTQSLQLILKGPGARFADLFATEESQITLRTVVALDRDQQYLILQTTPSNQTLPWLSQVTPGAFVEECELYERYGLRPSEGHYLNRLVVAPVSDPSHPRLDEHEPPVRDTHIPFTVGGHAFEFPVGPVRASGVESLYYGLVTSGEETVDLFLHTWHKYRGIEPRLRGMTASQALFLVERGEGLSAVSSAVAFARAVESALGLAVPDQVARTRAICVELERLYNHAQCAAALAQSTGLFIGQAQAEIALEKLLRLNAAVAGHRYLFGTVQVAAGSQIDTAALKELLPAAYGRLRRVLDGLLDTNSFLDRLEATGIVTTEQCSELGLVGPIARACGASIDARFDHPTTGFSVPSFSAAVRTGGDALARLLVLREEIDQSARLIAMLDDGELHLAVPVGEASRWGLGAAESPRGETLAWVELDEQHRLTRARIRTGSTRNWRAFDNAVRAQNVFTDVPIIEASFWLTVAGRAL